MILSFSAVWITPGTTKSFMNTTNWMPKHLRLPLLVLWCAAQGLALPSTHAATSSADSNITTVDTRGTVSGTLTGVVQGSGLALASAQVRIDSTSYTTNTASNGTFTLTNVPTGSGYLLKVSAAGFASKSVPGVNVDGGTTDVGTIQLAPLSGPFRVIPLQPDVNPVVTQVEDGGVGYRYYVVTSSDGKSPAGKVNVSLRIAGGAAIPQAGDVSDTWAGYTSGISDADGIVRLRIPAASLGAVNSAQALEVLESGAVKANFQAKMVPRQYYQVWKHKVGGGASGTIAAWKVGGTTALETELRHLWRGSVIWEETIKGKWEAEGRAGLEISTPGMKLGSLKAGASAGAGVYLGIDIASSHSFPADIPDEVLNVYKVLVALGGPMVESDGLAHSLGDFLAWYYGTDLLQLSLAGSEGGVHLGGYANGEALFEVGSFGKLNAKAGAEFDGHLGGFLGYENTVMPNEHATVLGLEAELSGSVGGVLGYMKYNQSKLRGLGLQFSGAVSQTIAAKAVTAGGGSYPSRVEVEFRGETAAGIDLSVIGWKGVTQQLDPSQKVETSETLSYALPSADAMNDLAVLGAGWELLKTGFGAQTQLKSQHADDLTRGILEAPEAHNNVLGYTRTLYTAKTWELPLAVELKAIFEGLSLHLDAKTERGAEAVLERGQIWHSLRMPLQWYANNTADLIPSDTLLAKEVVWIGYAAAPLGKALNRVESTVSSGVQTVVSAGEGATRAVVSFGAGVMDAGSALVSRWRNSLFGSGGSLKAHFAKSSYFGDPVVYGATSLIPSNYIYGLSGVFRFESTNSFHGTGALAMAYTDASVAGLEESNLRIYRLSDDTNRWVLVGGAVDTVSNIVTATITNLGTYAIAPPLPTGELQLILSTNALPADGVSQMTAVVTNLMLNTGGVATQQWLFTATAVGVQILNPDMDKNAPGVQFFSTNGMVTLVLRAPSGGSAASVSLGSVAGDAFGSVGIQLVDDAAPTAPASVVATAGQSRIAVSWRTNSEPDFAGYRVYYRMGQSGPPWDGTAAVDGAPSPVQVGGTNWLLRGLTPETNYFVAVSAVDTTGNESSLSSAIQVATTQGLPAPPSAVSARFGLDATNVLMWALSEDDGYNDRDVVRYDILRASLPGGSYVKVGEAAAGVGLYSETNPTIGTTQFVSYAVVAVGSNGLSSAQAVANRLMADGTGVDNDGDGIPDSWMVQYFGHPTGLVSDQSFGQDDPDHDGLSNLQEYQLGLNPMVPDRPYLQPLLSPTNGRFALNILGLFGRSVTLEVSTSLTNWQTLTNLTSTNAVIYFEDWRGTNSGSRFYRAVVP